MPPTVFAGGEARAWEVESIDPVTGPSLPMVSRLDVVEDSAGAGSLDAAWMLRERQQCRHRAPGRPNWQHDARGRYGMRLAVVQLSPIVDMMRSAASIFAARR